MEALSLVEEVCEQGNNIRSDDAWLNLLLIRIELLNKLGRYNEAINFAQEGLFLARVDEAYKRLKEARELAMKYDFEKLLYDILLNMSDICKRKNLPDYHKITGEFQEVSISLVKGRKALMKHQIGIPKKVAFSRPPNDKKHNKKAPILVMVRSFYYFSYF